MISEKESCCDTQCGLFEFMSQEAGIKVLHPGGMDSTQKLLEAAQINSESNILDLACGAGTTSFFIANRYDANITGIDIDEILIEQANEKLESRQNKKMKFTVADALTLPYPEATFDLVIAQAFLILIDEQKQALNEIYRVLKPGGIFASLELSWNKIPDKNGFDELVEKTCNTFIPRMKTFDDWIGFFENSGFREINALRYKMPSGMIQMLKAEGIKNFLHFMFRMISRSLVRKRMMDVQTAFKKYDEFVGYGIYSMKKQM